jgi:hypothetical protein
MFLVLSVFSSTKLENRRAEQVLSSRGMVGVSTTGRGGGNGERGWRMNMEQILYTHVCKCKNDTY